MYRNDTLDAPSPSPDAASVRPRDRAGTGAPMIARHTLTYVGSRIVSAALAMASLAVFTRLAPVEIYGTFLFVQSWAIVLYGATCTWPKFAFFALYDEARSGALAGTILRVFLGTVLLAALIAGGAAAFGLTPPLSAAAIIAMVFGMTVFEASVEIARTRLAAEEVGLSVVARGALTLGLGSAALKLTGDPIDLALALAAANVLAALPALRSIWPLLRESHASLAEARRLAAYGWPLVLSFGIAALAQNIDRLIIARTVGTDELGAYGAASDFLRQCFVVFGEGIALSAMSIAKRDARAGGMEAARPVLRDAVRLMTVVSAFGAVFFLSFGDVVVPILLGPGYREAALALLPFLVAASICVLFRAYYFGQGIYFADSSVLEAIASGVMLVTVGGLALVLIPDEGTRGAAIALAAGQAAACLVFVLGARRGSRMPVPLGDTARIVLGAVLTGAVLWLIGRMPGGTEPAMRALKLVLLAAAAAATVWRLDIMGVAGALDRLRRAR